MAPTTYTLTFLGDIMLGRLIDQLLPIHVDEPEDARHAAYFRKTYSHLGKYSFASPWGNALPFLHKSDFVLGNLETAVTTSPIKWPNKVFNYRMHPKNIECLKAAKIAYVSLANNHTLDFGEEGLFETIKVVEDSGIAYAGAGPTVDDAQKPAVLTLPQSEREIHLYAFSDHPCDWSKVSQFNLLSYDSASKSKIKDLVTKQHAGLASKPDLKICSVHWGPNYSWKSSNEITSFAHFLIDECAVDIIHGHSSHHIQGVEIYNGKLIIYGCGDFVDDYAVTPEYRNDLSAAWNVQISADESKPVELQKLEVFPNRIKKFQAELLCRTDPDHEWICKTFRHLCSNLGTAVEQDLGNEGQILVKLKEQSANTVGDQLQ